MTGCVSQASAPPSLPNGKLSRTCYCYYCYYYYY